MLLILTLSGAASVGLAQAAEEGRRDDRSARAEVFLGLEKWDDLAELVPAANGRFDSTGFGLGGAFHWRIAARRNRDVLAGLDLALFSNESNVRHFRHDVVSRGLYITPSVKVMFDDGAGPRYAFDFGLGYYLADVAEVETFDFGGYWEDEIWEDSAFGGYVGASIDFEGKNSWQGGFSFSVKAHFFDLGDVRDEEPVFFGPGTLGPNAGSLSGPVIMLQFGYHWLLGD